MRPKYSGLTPESSNLTHEMFRQITSTFRCSSYRKSSGTGHLI